MQQRYLPDTPQDRKEMLDFLNVDSTGDLFHDVPEDIRLRKDLNLPAALSESELTKHMRKLASANRSAGEYTSFLGAGTYDHFTPSVVQHMISRSEFYTAYTPYQPEMSQGELQGIFEFQTMICELTGMDVANSSMYDGYTALAEAASLAIQTKKRAKIVVSRAVHPESRQVMQPVALGQHYDVQEVQLNHDITDLDDLARKTDDETAAVVVQYPNFFGSVEDLLQIKKIAEQNGALLIVSANPLALSILQAPGKLGADIVVGDAQPFGIPMSFGGPHCGFFAVGQKLMRKVPGRIVGQTVDKEGTRGYVLTLQAREQHIRRDKASSNICSNQSLNALAAAVFMTALGKHGIREMAQMNVEKAEYMRKRLQEKGIKVVNEAPFFHEMVLELPTSVKVTNERLLQAKMIGGYDLSADYSWDKRMLIAVTEQRTKAEIDEFVHVLEGSLS